MKRISVLFAALIFIFFVFTACDGEKDVNAKEGPSGSQNIDVSGKTFSYEEPGRSIYKSETEYDSKGNPVSKTRTSIVITKGVTTVVFDADGTLTITQEEVFTSNFDDLYTWKYLPKDERASSKDSTTFTYTEYNLSEFDQYERPYTTSSAKSGETVGDTQSKEYSYEGTTASKTVYTGTWKKFELYTDGLANQTLQYQAKIDKYENSALVVVKSAPSSSFVGETGDYVDSDNYNTTNGYMYGDGYDKNDDGIADGVDVDDDGVIDYDILVGSLPTTPSGLVSTTTNTKDFADNVMDDFVFTYRGKTSEGVIEYWMDCPQAYGFSNALVQQ